jgi:hypothetical protein
MFFSKKKKKNEEEEGLAPRAPRYDSLAAVRVNGFEGQALLKNISITGFCMQSKTFANLTPGKQYTMYISPEASTGLATIEVEVEVRWIRSEVSRFDVGLLIAKPLLNKTMDTYINYLKMNPSPANFR